MAPLHNVYPALRVARDAGAVMAVPLAGGGYYEGTAGAVTLGATDAEVIVFSGEPQHIQLTAHAQDALVTLTDEHGRDGHTMRVPAGQTVLAPVRRRRVVAREVAAGALLTAVGYWSR